MSEKKKFLAFIGMGMGRNLVATGVLKKLAEMHPGCIIDAVVSYPDMFRLLPFVRRAYAGQEVQGSYFREQHADFEILNQEPYSRLQFRRGEEHLSEAWLRSWGFESDGVLPGVIKLLAKEHEAALAMLHGVDRSKPWVAFQPWGGTSCQSPEAAMNILRPRQVRDIPVDIAQGIVDRLVERGCNVIQFSLPTERRLEKTHFLNLGMNEQTKQPHIIPSRVLTAALKLCQKFIGIDSSMQHTWAALGRDRGDSVVLWGATNPANFSYHCHIDLFEKRCPTPRCGRPDTALPDTVDGGQAWECPHDAACMSHNPDTVVNTLFSEGETQNVRDVTA
jgi:ADP-heptose:LPS heptosyltransferase